MLNYQKNKLTNLILQFEIELNNEINDINIMPIGSVTKDVLKSINIISRNIQSIKKQIKKL